MHKHAEWGFIHQHNQVKPEKTQLWLPEQMWEMNNSDNIN